MNGAVTSVRPARVRREDNKVWLAGVDELAGWGHGEENTFIGALRAALAARGERVSYDRLMGVSGAAFRLQVARPRWCPSACDATVGFDCCRPAVRAFGYEADLYRTLEEEATPEACRATLDAVIDGIESGRPAVAINLAGDMDWGLITGYDEGSFLCRTYGDPEGDYARATAWPPIVVIPRKVGTAVKWSESFRDSLRLAVRLARTPRFGQYLSGFWAYEAWIRDLSRGAEFREASSEERQRLMRANAWCYQSLYDARAAAARYLAAERDACTADARPALSEAAELYERMAGILLDEKACAPFPGTRGAEEWTDDMRRTQVAVLRRLLDLEREAVARLQEAAVAVGS